MTGPTAGSPAPTGAGPLRRVTILLEIAEPVEDDFPAAAAAEFDAALTASVLAVLADNGYAVASARAQSTPGDDLTVAWPMWARQLAAHLEEVATAQRAATVAHAEAYLAAEGTQQYRAASADLAAAEAVEAHAKLAGRAEAFRMVLAGQAGRDALSATAGPAWPRPPEPDDSMPSPWGRVRP